MSQVCRLRDVKEQKRRGVDPVDSEIMHTTRGPVGPLEMLVLNCFPVCRLVSRAPVRARL